MIGLPSLSVTQPGNRFEPTRVASRTLLAAIELGRDVKQERWLRVRWGGDGDRIGAKARFGAEGRDHAGLGGGHAHPHHICLRRQHGVVACGSQVTPVVHGDNAHASCLGFIDGNAHGLGTEDDTEPTIAIDRGGAG